MNLIDKNPQDKDTKYGKHKKSNNDEIGLSRHKPIANPTAINNAVERQGIKIFLTKHWRV
ncbi:MAG: hypothetical protein ACRD5B_09465 [Nitrososphaeraceae archaeon]